MKVQDKKDEWTVRRRKVLDFVKLNAGNTADSIAVALNMAKKTVLPLLEELEHSFDIKSSGAGIKGDPRLYSGTVVTVGKPVSTVCPNCHDATDSQYHKEVCQNREMEGAA